MVGLEDQPSPSVSSASDIRNVMSKGCSTLFGVASARNAIPAVRASSVREEIPSEVISVSRLFSSISDSLAASVASVPASSSVCGVSANALMRASMSSSSALRSSFTAVSNA